MDIWVVSSFNYYNECCYEHPSTYMLAFLLSIYLGIELLGIRKCMFHFDR